MAKPTLCQICEPERYAACVKPCKRLAADLARVEKPRRRHRIKILYEYQLTGEEASTYYDNAHGVARPKE